MTWTTGSGIQRGGFADGQEGGSSWVKGYRDGSKTREYCFEDTGWGARESVPVAVGRTSTRTERGLLAAGAALAVVLAVVLRTASHAQDAAGAEALASTAVSWGHLGLGVLCFGIVAGLVLVARRR